MNKLEHFLLPEHHNRLYTEEAISSVSLVRNVADKINELIDAYNELNEYQLAKHQEQDGAIRKGILYMKDNLLNTLHELYKLYVTDEQFRAMVYGILSEDFDALYNYVTPQMFGAKGDGETDDTQAIQSALTFAETHGKHTVFFPVGVYRVGGDGAIFKSKFVSLIGDNATIYVTRGSNTTDLFKFTGTTDNYNGVITGLRFDYQSKNYTMINNVFNFVFEKESDILYGLEISKCWFGKNYGYKIYTEGFSNGGFNNCRFNENIVYGLFMKSLSFGDSNKINGNSLYGSEEIQLSGYVIDLKQTAGSSGCEVCSNNCTSGLGSFEGFQNLRLFGNQIENTKQKNLDYLIKLTGGNCITIDNCNLNGHYNGGLIFATGVYVAIKNCNWYGTKDGAYALNNNNTHITFLENVRFFDGDNILFQLSGDVVNGTATNVLYDDKDKTMWIDNDLNLHIRPKITGSFNIAPVNINTDKSELYIPVEVVNGKLLTIKVINKYSLRTETLVNAYAVLPVKYF